MTQPEPSERPTKRKQLWRSVLAVAACVASAAVLLSLARRPVTSVDLGYHLAYGRQYLQTGRIVSDDSFIYPAVSADDAGQLPPGAYFDEANAYRFPNANWLTQTILAWGWDRGSFVAMNLTLMGCIIAVAVAQAMILRRLAVPWVWLAGVWMAAALVGYERFMVRPEMFAFVCLTWQLWLLCGKITWPRVVAFIAVQIVAVNLHSYWMLGAGLAMAFFADAAARAAWNRWMIDRPTVDANLRRRLIRLTMAAGAMIPAAMIHPTGPANAIYPLRTLSFLSEHDIQGAGRDDVSRNWRAGTLHPWQTISEFHAPFSGRCWSLVPTWALATLLGLAAAATVILLLGRRWAPAMVTVAFSAVSLSMRRNMIIPAFVATPLIALAAHMAIQWLRGRKGDRTGRDRLRIAGTIAMAVTVVIGAFGVWFIATDRLYLRERRTVYFGGGVSALSLPVNTCRWLDENLPAPQPAFVDQSISSSILNYSEKVTGVPTLTNTWATPPSRIDRIFQIGDGRAPITELDRWGLDIAVLQGWPINGRGIRSLLRSPQWAPVHIDGWYIVFARRTEANAAMIAAHELHRGSFDTEAFIRRCRGADPLAVISLKTGATMLQLMGWYGPAADVWTAVTDAPQGARYAEAWLNRGVCLAVHAGNRLRAGDDGGVEDLLEARRSFQTALDLRPTYAQARKNLRQVKRDLELLKRSSPASTER